MEKTAVIIKAFIALPQIRKHNIIDNLVAEGADQDVIAALRTITALTDEKVQDNIFAHIYGTKA